MVVSRPGGHVRRRPRFREPPGRPRPGLPHNAISLWLLQTRNRALFPPWWGLSKGTCVSLGRRRRSLTCSLASERLDDCGVKRLVVHVFLSTVGCWSSRALRWWRRSFRRYSAGFKAYLRGAVVAVASGDLMGWSTLDAG
jgi:hypothetical protein